jgi:acetoin utilization protein AcuB
MNVSDLMITSPITADPQMPVLEARQLMISKRIRHLLVMDGPKLAGILTDRDIRLNMPSPATSLSIWELNYLIARMTVGSVMTKKLVTVGPRQDAREAALVMLDNKVGALPVVDRGQLVGIVTETDLLRAFVKTA